MAISRKRKQRAQPAPAMAQAQQRAIDQTFLPIAIGQILASIEALAIKKLYKDDGLLRGVSSIGQPAEGVAGKVRLMIDSPHTPRILATATLVASGTLLMGRGRRRTQIAASAVIAIANRVNEFRTPYGRDGADQMTGIITQYRTLSALVPNRELSDDLFLRALNIQAGLSYFVSGISKLFGSSWVQGDAIGEILQTEAYGRGPAASVLRRFPRVVRLLTWVTPLWEVGFPIVYSLPSRWAHVALIAVKGFHVGVATVMELPRFVWGFAGSHGAVQYVVDQRRRGHRSLGNLERSVLTTAGVAVSVSVAYAASQRELDIVRRRGLKGTKVLDVGDGLVEYDLRTPTDSSIAAGEAPIIILEAGLGSPLASFSWLAEMLSEQHHVLSYHRSGYGLTTSKKSPGELVSELLGRVDSTGKLISVSHSIGSLVAATYCASDLGGRRIEAIVIVDGTDPKVLAQDRADRRRRGAFLQAQLGSMFVALSGVYNFVPNAISRQSAYAPDDQMGVVQFSFSPGNILRATRDYFAIPTADAIQALETVGRRRVIASKEYEKQEMSLASSLNAPFTLIENSSHRSILGYRAYAQRVADIIREVV